MEKFLFGGCFIEVARLGIQRHTLEKGKHRELWAVLKRESVLSLSLRGMALSFQLHESGVSPSRKSPGSEMDGRFHQAVALGAERSARQAREAEEQRSPFWGTRLAIPLPGTGRRRYTSSLTSQRETAARHRGYRRASSSSSSARFGTAPRRHLSLSVCLPTPSFLFADPPDAVAVRTLSPLLWRFGQAAPYPGSGQHFFPLPGVPDFASWSPDLPQCPVVAPSGRIRHALLLLYSLEILYKLFPVPKVNLPLLHGSSLVWLLLGLFIMEPVSQTLQCFYLQFSKKVRESQHEQPLHPLKIRHMPQLLFQSSLRYLSTPQLQSPPEVHQPPQPLFQTSLRDLPMLQLLSPLRISESLQFLSPLEASQTLQLLSSLEVSQTPQCQLQPFQISLSKSSTKISSTPASEGLRDSWGPAPTTKGQPGDTSTPAPASTGGQPDSSVAAPASVSSEGSAAQSSSSSSTHLPQTSTLSSSPPVSPKGGPVVPVPEFREGFESKPPPVPVPEFREGFEGEPPSSLEPQQSRRRSPGLHRRSPGSQWFLHRSPGSQWCLHRSPGSQWFLHRSTES
ncbi:hypothetical protein CRENBAI_018867 [Crenichthys baileyi]|uniref:Uncharacterized protein n=1 Tax=Crenichthys baileyi TaxID=28760 RepID=A0AAV9R3K5_9TELE